MLAPTPLTDTRIQLHYAIQSIAATGMALAKYQPDDSQMTCHWHPDLHAFVGHKLPGVQPIYPSSVTFGRASRATLLMLSFHQWIREVAHEIGSFQIVSQEIGKRGIWGRSCF